MSGFKRLSILLTLCTTLVGMLAGQVRPDIVNAAALFLNNVNSPEANGMGGCVVNSIDEQAGVHNPAALGLFHLNHTASVAAPSTTKWYQDFQDITFKTWSVGAGGSYRLIDKAPAGRFDASIGVSYSRMRMDYGLYVITGETSPQPVDTVEVFDQATAYSVGIGIDYYLRAGIGITVKNVKLVTAHETTHSRAYDVGMLLELPIHRLRTNGVHVGGTDERPLDLRLLLSMAFVRANSGNDVVYVYSGTPRTDPLPKVYRIGFSVAAALDLREKELLSARLCVETQSPVNPGELRSQTGDVLQSWARIDVSKTGVELGVLGGVYCRFGRFESNSLGESLSTWGMSFHLRSIVDWLGDVDRMQPPRNTLESIVRRADLSYCFAEWEDSDTHPQADLKFAKLCLSF